MEVCALNSGSLQKENVVIKLLKSKWSGFVVVEFYQLFKRYTFFGSWCIMVQAICWGWSAMRYG